MIEPGSLPPGTRPNALQVLRAAVRRLVHHLVRAFAQVDRLEDVEVECVLDVAANVPRRQQDVDDDGILRIRGIDFAECLADDLLVLTDARPRVAAEGRRLGGDDLNPRDARFGRRWRQGPCTEHGETQGTRHQARQSTKSCVISRPPLDGGFSREQGDQEVTTPAVHATTPPAA